MKEISRRCMLNDEVGMACGPCGVIAADAEMVVEDEGKTVYLHVQWISEAPGFLDEATAESVYDLYNGISHDEGDVDALVRECERISAAGIESLFPACDIQERYGEQFREMEQTIKNLLAEHGYEIDEEEEEDEDPE